MTIRVHRNRNPAWTPFERAHFSTPVTFELPGLIQNHETAESIEHQLTKETVWLNSRYQVYVIENVPNGFGMLGITWLSIRNQTRDARHDWRDLQRIKNELCGPDRDAVEIYPAEYRLHDTSDQFHLFVFPAGKSFPLGFIDRFVSDASRPGTGSQRKFGPGFGHDDNLNEEELAASPILVKFHSHKVFNKPRCHSCGASACEHGPCADTCDVEGCRS